MINTCATCFTGQLPSPFASRASPLHARFIPGCHILLVACFAIRLFRLLSCAAHGLGQAQLRWRAHEWAIHAAPARIHTSKVLFIGLTALHRRIIKRCSSRREMPSPPHYFSTRHGAALALSRKRMRPHFLILGRWEWNFSIWYLI